MMDELKKFSIFSGLPDKYIQKLGEIVILKTYKSGTTIFSLNTPGDALYLVMEGEVTIRKPMDMEGTKYKTLAVVEKGDFFGEMSLLKEGGLRSASAFATQDSSVAILPKKEFQKMFDTDTGLAKELMISIVDKISERLRLMNHYFVTVYQTGMITGSTEDLNSIADQILDKIIFAIDSAQSGLFILWNQFNREYEVIALKGFPDDKTAGISVPADEPFIKQLIDEHRVLRKNQQDIQEPTPLSGYFGRSVIGGPLMDEGNAMGFLVLSNNEKSEAFHVEDQVLLGTVINQIIPAIKICLYRREEQDMKRLKERRFWERKEIDEN